MIPSLTWRASCSPTESSTETSRPGTASSILNQLPGKPTLQTLTIPLTPHTKKFMYNYKLVFNNFQLSFMKRIRVAKTVRNSHKIDQNYKNIILKKIDYRLDNLDNKFWSFRSGAVISRKGFGDPDPQHWAGPDPQYWSQWLFTFMTYIKYGLFL